jgi:predicted ester cyclase
MTLNLKSNQVTEANKRLIHQLFEAINAGNFSALEGHPGFWESRQVVPPLRAIFSDWQTVQLQQIAEADKVFSYGVVEMTHIGNFAGVAPTGKRIVLEGFFIEQIKEGIVIEHNGATSWVDVMRQLGTPAFQSWPARKPRPLTLGTRDYSSAPAANKAIVAQLLQALSQGDSGAAELGHRAIDPLMAEFAAIRTAFPDLQTTLVVQLAEGDLVATRVMLRGTHLGELYGLAPTARMITWDLFSFARLARGIIVEHHSNVDWLAALMHLGLIASPAEQPNIAQRV